MDESGKVERSDEGKLIVTVSKNYITLMHNDDNNDTMEGTITENICNWETPFKNGKSTFNTSLVERSGQTNDASVSIEGKEGKVVILINFKNRGKIIRLLPDSYKE